MCAPWKAKGSLSIYKQPNLWPQIGWGLPLIALAVIIMTVKGSLFTAIRNIYVDRYRREQLVVIEPLNAVAEPADQAADPIAARPNARRCFSMSWKGIRRGRLAHSPGARAARY